MENLVACCWSLLGKPREEVPALIVDVWRAHAGAAVVESCQRIEAYSTTACVCNAEQRFSGREAVVHLAEVATGLHSVVLGEAQILGQVRDGFAAAAGELRQAGDLALAAARELRAGTRFDSHAGHLLDRALRLRHVPGRESILVLGSGQVGRLVAARAREVGFERVILAGRRRPERIDAGVSYLPIGRALALPGPFTVVAGCLGSGAGALAAGALPAARLVLDLGTPPNFVPDPARPTVGLAELLAGEQARPHAMRRRAALAASLRALLEERLRQQSANAGPVAALRSEVERIRQRELARMRRLHPEVPAASLEVMSRALVNQLFHLPSERLKREGDEFGERVARLFAP